jgi:eukaryotic-like serine/threonine-protein kinase
VIEAALSVAPADRPADAGAMLAMLAPVVAKHAATLTAGDISAHLRKLFPDGWEPTPTQSLVADITPVTRLLAQTYATRLTSVTPGELPGADASIEAARASLSGAHRSDEGPVAPPSAVRRALGTIGVVAAAVGVTWLLMRPAPVPIAEPKPAAPEPPKTSPRGPAPEGPGEGPLAAAPPALHSADTGEVRASELGDSSEASTPSIHRLTVVPDDAEVVVDGTMLPGPGPYAIELTSDAARRVEVRKRGFQTRTLLLDVDAGASSAVGLEPAAPRGKGSLQVVALGVPWAEVTIDGRRHGSTPTKKIELPEGRHRVVVRCVPDACAQARTLFSGHVTIAAGDSRKLVAD